MGWHCSSFMQCPLVPNWKTRWSILKVLSIFTITSPFYIGNSFITHWANLGSYFPKFFFFVFTVNKTVLQTDDEICRTLPVIQKLEQGVAKMKKEKQQNIIYPPPPRKNDRSDKLERIPFILAIDITYFISSRCWYSQHFTLNLVIMKDNKTFETLWLDYGVWWWSSGQNTRLWDKTYWDRSNHNREREREHRNGF